MSARQVIVEKFVQSLTTFYNEMFQTIERASQNDAKNITTARQKLLEDKERLKECCNIDDYNIINSIFDEYMEIYRNMTTAVIIANNKDYISNAAREKTPTKIALINLSRHHMNDSLEKFNELDNRDIGDMIITKGEEELIELLEKNKSSSNKFIFMICEHLLDKYKSAGAVRFLEYKKDEILMTQRKNGPIEQRYLSSNYTPVTPFMELKEVFAKLQGSYNPELSVLDNFSAHSVILFYNISSSQMEFNLRGIIDKEWIDSNDIATPITSGLSLKVLKRFQTVIKHEGDVPAKENRIYKFTGGSSTSQKNNNINVLETFNGTTFRFLQSLSPNATDNFLNGASTRAHEYNKIQSEIIHQKYLDNSLPLLLDEFNDEKKINVAIDEIRSKLIDAKGIQFDSETIESLGKMYSILQSGNDKIILDAMIHKSGMGSSVKSEFMMVYIMKLEYLVTEFGKKIEFFIAKHRRKINDNIFKELNGKDLTDYLKKHYNTILTDAVEALHADRMWTDLDINFKQFVMIKKNY